MDTNDFVDFNKIREIINIDDPSLFAHYMKEVFKDLSERSLDKKKGVNKNTFMDYIKLPVLISEKLFNSLDLDKDDHLNMKEFIEGLKQLYLGGFEETIASIFKIIDFDNDGIIHQGDVKIILSYLPLKNENSKIEYKYQMESQEEIGQIINQTFGKKSTLTLNEFTEVTEQKKSDVYLQLLCFLYQLKPFDEHNVNTLKVTRRRARSIIIEEPEKISPVSKPKRLPSPNRKSYLSPADSFFKISLLNNKEKSETISSPKKKLSFNEPEILGFSNMVRLPNWMIPKECSEDFNTVVKNSKNVYNSPTTYFKRQERKISDFNLVDNLIKMEEMSLDNEKEPNKKGNVTYQDWIYKLSEANKLKKYFLVLIGKDIYYYKNEKKEELLGMHNLSGCFIRYKGEEVLSGEKYYLFKIDFPGKTRDYYVKTKEVAQEWVGHLSKSIGYLNFFEHYDMKEEIGSGKFGLVRLGIHKNTKEKVAIKIIKKEAMTPKDMELVKCEIDIMKLCRHPNVVRLLDHFENAEYIFLVMEYIAGGDLNDYFKKTKFEISEARAAQIITQLALGLKYLHQFGILHRDLKPENIMLSECHDTGVVKIMDFGLSKIMGPAERAEDGFGTLTYVAPEVLLRTPYNQQIDIWSLGVILYYMLSSVLPFDDESDNEEVIAKMIVFSEVQFPSKFWSKRSQLVLDLIAKCLIKDPEKRITIDGFLANDWIKKFLNR